MIRSQKLFVTIQYQMQFTYLMVLTKLFSFWFFDILITPCLLQQILIKSYKKLQDNSIVEKIIKFSNYIQGYNKQFDDIEKSLQLLISFGLQKMLWIGSCQNAYPLILGFLQAVYVKQLRIQKANAPDEAIAIYNSYLSKGIHHQKYLATTFRILTRLLQNRKPYEIYRIKSFFKEKLKEINQIELGQLQIQDFKDMLLFLMKYSSNKISLDHQQKQMISRFVTYYFQFFKREKIENQVQYFALFVSSIKLMDSYSRPLQRQFYMILLRIIHNHKSILIGDNMTFMNLVTIIQQIYQPSNRYQNQFVCSLCRIIIDCDPVATFQQGGLLVILTSMQIINYRLSLLTQRIVQVSSVINIIEQNILQTFLDITQRTLQPLIIDLLKYNKNSRILSKFFKIISLSINKKGETCINPLINIFALPYLKKQDTYLLMRQNQSWQENFILFLNRYFNKDNKFSREISSQIRQLISLRLLKWSNTLKLYEFYLNAYLYSKKLQPFYDFVKLIQNAYIFALMFDYHKSNSLVDKINQYLNKLQQIWQKNKQKKFDSLIFWENFSQFLAKIRPQSKKFLNSNRSERQNLISRDLLEELSKINKFKFISQFTYRLAIMQIKLYYINGQSKYIPLILNHKKIGEYAVNYILKDKMIKNLIIQTKISSIHYEEVFKWLASFYSNSYQKLQEVIYSIVQQQNLRKQYTFSYYPTSMLYFFYTNYSKSNFDRLLFVSKDLLTKIFLFNKEEVIDFVFKRIRSNPQEISQYQEVIYHMLNICFKYNVDAEYLNSQFVLESLSKSIHLVDSNFMQIVINFYINNNIFYSSSLSNLLQKMIDAYNEQTRSQKIQPLKSAQIKFIKKLKKQDQSIYNILNSQNQTGLNQMITNLAKSNEIKLLFTPNKKGQQHYSAKILSLHMNFMRKLQKIKYPLHSRNEFVKKILENLIVNVLKEPIYSQYTKFQIFKFLIHNHLYCGQFAHEHLDYFQSAEQIRPDQFLSLVAQYPIAKQQSLIADNMQHFAVNTDQNLYSLTLIYALIDNPSQSITIFVKKMIQSQFQMIPLFFRMYLCYFNSKIYSQLFQQRNQWDKYFDRCQKQQIKIELTKVNQLFCQPLITLSDFYDIELGIKRQGCHKMILRKIINKIRPEKSITFQDQMQHNPKSKRLFGNLKKYSNK